MPAIYDFVILPKYISNPNIGYNRLYIKLRSIAQLSNRCEFQNRLITKIDVRDKRFFTIFKVKLHFRVMHFTRKCSHFDGIFIICFIRSYQNDNLQCSKWRKFRQNNNISVSVISQRFRSIILQQGIRGILDYESHTRAFKTMKDIRDLRSTSNVDVPGVWIYDLGGVNPGGYSETITMTS